MELNPSLKLFGWWASPFVQRVHLGLKLKRLQYEYSEEDVYGNKSSELLRYNPVYKKVPVFVHGDRPVLESAVILEYIDEIWNNTYPLLPSDPYEKAVVRFWHRFWDDKIDTSARKIVRTCGEEQKVAAEELRTTFQILEDELCTGFLLKGRRFFAGDQIGFLDIIYGCGSYGVLEKIAGMKLMDPEAFPRLHAWYRDFNEQKYVRETSPPEEKLLESIRAIRAHVLPDLEEANGNHK